MKFSRLIQRLLIIVAALIINSCAKKTNDNPEPVKSPQKEITSFSIAVSSSTVTGTIQGLAISLSVPFGTTVTALSPTIAVSDKASVSPASGTPQNFSSPVSYTVTAEDGTKQVYMVTVNVGKNSAKSITSFSFQGLSPAVIGVINEAAHSVTATVPAGTDITSLVPTIVLAQKATVSPASGVATNFTNSVNYQVTAEDGSSQVYKATVAEAAPVTQMIDCSNIPNELKDLGIGIDYIVTCNLTLTGNKVLTVDPGVTIQFQGAGAGITIINGAALNMTGTAAKPIVLEGATNTPGAWLGIQISSNNIANNWQYVTVQNAGSGTYPTGLLIGDNYLADAGSGTQMSLTNCTFSNNKGFGIWEYDNKFIYPRVIFSKFSTNTFTNNTYSAMNVTIDAIGKLDSKSSYANNTEKFIQVTGVNGLHNNTVVQALDVPYVVTSYMALNQKLTVSPGVTMEFNTDCGFTLGTGTLIADGTTASPIKFIGYQPGKGTWIGLSLGNNDPDISLNYCTIDGAGSNKPNSGTACVTDTKAAINLFPDCNNWSTVWSVTNCTVSNSGGYGIVYKKGTGTTLSNNSYSNNTLTNEAAF